MFLENLTVATKLINGLGLAIVGMGVVFTTLVLISVALDLLRIAAARLESLAPATMTKNRHAKTPAKQPLQEEDELIAVITAAVAAASGTNTSDFTIRSIRPRPPQGSVWSLAGRQQQMKDRLKIQNRKGYQA